MQSHECEKREDGNIDPRIELGIYDLIKVRDWRVNSNICV